MIDITPTAATKVKELLEESGKSDHALRIFVRGMSCSGPAYGMALDNEPRDDDIGLSTIVLRSANQSVVHEAQWLGVALADDLRGLEDARVASAQLKQDGDAQHGAQGRVRSVRQTLKRPRTGYS